nr:hypothetical protein CFP56_73230 [Quercus suber]
MLHRLRIPGTYGFFSHSHGGLLSESHLGVLIRTSTLEGCNSGFCWDCSKHVCASNEKYTSEASDRMTY